MTTTTSPSMASCTAHMEMDDMDMGDMGADHSCKMSMLWNWYSIDACFISSDWHIKSNGAFAGFCIGVVGLVIVLEALRRLAKEYDAYLARKNDPAIAADRWSMNQNLARADTVAKDASTQHHIAMGPRFFTPSFFEQVIRAFLHTLQFAVAYIIMLLAMYFNGYIIICIFIGAFFGAFTFGWHRMPLVAPAKGGNLGVTGCCG